MAYEAVAKKSLGGGEWLVLIPKLSATRQYPAQDYTNNGVELGNDGHGAHSHARLPIQPGEELVVLTLGSGLFAIVGRKVST